jgi:ABC-type dipeptide/oligopeptide/nickel transport system permease component
MLRFLIRRFLALIALLIATSIVTFLLFFAGPSDPAGRLLRQGLHARAHRAGQGFPRPG